MVATALPKYLHNAANGNEEIYARRASDSGIRENRASGVNQRTARDASAAVTL